MSVIVRDVQRTAGRFTKDLMPRAARLTLCLTLLACVTARPAAPKPSARTLSTGQTPVVGMYPEVRLRKLHLVRPDLIPYPIMFEVCC